MRTMQLLLFFLLLWCEDTESLIHKRVNLGGNVTLNCSIGVKEIHWVFQKLSDSPVIILRTFSSESTSALIQEERFKDKYSSLTLSRLFISNITDNELGIYYCVKTSLPLQLSNGTRLYINESVKDVNHTEVNPCHYQTTQQPPIVLYVVLIIAMFSPVIGLFLIRLWLCKKRRRQCKDEQLNQFYYTNVEEFSEVEFHLFVPSDKTFLPFQKPKMTHNRD